MPRHRRNTRKLPAAVRSVPAPVIPRDVSQVVRGVAQRAVVGFEPQSVAAVLHAACSSPGAVHRLPSVAGMWAAAQSAMSSGSATVTPADLEQWVRRLRNAVPLYEQLEDWLPLDVRSSVIVRHRGWLWPLHPGLLQRPRELITQLQRWAEVADEALLSYYGFGLGDLIEVALRTLAAEWRLLAASWDGAVRASGPAAPASVTQEEIESAERLLAAWREVSPETGLPIALRQSADSALVEQESQRFKHLTLALEFATISPEQLDPFPAGGQRRVPGLALRTQNGLAPIPAGLVLDALAGLAIRLLTSLEAASTSQQDPSTASLVEELAYGAEQLFRNSASNLLAHLVTVRTAPGARRSLLLCPAARHVVAVQVAAGFSGKQIARAIERARRDLRLIRPDASLYTDGGLPDDTEVPDAALVPVEPAVLTGPSGRVCRDAEITRVVLVEGPGWAQRRRPRGAVVLTMEEWRYLVSHTTDPEQLWAFLDEIAEQPGLARLGSYDLRDLWITFQQFGLFNPSGEKLEGLFVPAQDLEADWQREATLSATDEMLASWGLGAVDLWPAAAVEPSGRVTLTDMSGFGWLLANTHHGFAMCVLDSEHAFDHHNATIVAQSVHDALSALADAARQPDAPPQVSSGWQVWRGLCEKRPLLIELIGMTLDPAGGATRLVVRPHGGRLAIAYDPSLLRSLGTAAGHEELGAILADGVLALSARQVDVDQIMPDEEVVDGRQVAAQNPEAAAAREAFLAAWATISAQLRVGWFNGPSFDNTVFVPAQITDPGRTRAGRTIAAYLHRHNIRPQKTSGTEAVALLTELCPMTLDVLNQELSAFTGAEALRSAAEQIERFWDLRHRNQQERALRAGVPELADAHAESAESLTGRAADLLAEALAGKHPAGGARLDHRDWIRLLHLAGECIHLSQQLSAARCGLFHLEIEILSGGVLAIDYGDELVDLPRHHLERSQVNARLLAGMVDDNPHDADEITDPLTSHLRTRLRRRTQLDRQTQESRTAARVLALDDAMLDTMGAGLDEIMAILATAISWPVPGDPQALTAIVTIDQLVAHAQARFGLEPERLAAATRWLILTNDQIASEGLRYWSIEARDARLALRPLIQVESAPRSVLVLPRRTSGTGQLLENYLADARLPWINRVLPGAVVNAQRSWKQLADRAFELQVDQHFSALGIVHRKANLKPEVALHAGLSIPGEIDELAADPDRRIVWVVEAKNPSVPFDPDQILYEVVQFNGVTPDVAPRVKAHQAKHPEKSYTAKLLAKTEQVRRQLPAALALLGIDTSARDGWRVVPLMITSRPCAAAVAPNARVTFATLAGLDRLPEQ